MSAFFTPKAPRAVMKLTTLLTVFACALLSSAGLPTKTVKRTDQSQFVSTQGGKFFVNGSEFNFIGTNAYWLASLNSEQDIIDTLANISRAGITVVRTWAFNDVTEIPENGTWFQLISNGTTAINNGTNGLQKLDMVIDHAERFGIYILLSLTNNWAPAATDNLTNSIGKEHLHPPVQSRATAVEAFNSSRPRNFLSNDYGGMDVYVRQFGFKNHNDFYTNETLINTFKNYTDQIVTRYIDRPGVLAWEVANDPRCNSTVAASPDCNTQNITSWHATISTHIKMRDPNHLISSGSQGFLCMDCPKMFATPTPAPAPAPPTQPSHRAAAVRRAIPKPLTRDRIIQERNERWKKTRALLPKSERGQGSGIRIRGRWLSTPTKRQDDIQDAGSAFDGSQGVDSQDILGFPNISFGSFQLFPDQNSYGMDDPSLSAFENTLQIGLDWIKIHAGIATTFNKPVALIGFGLVTQDNAPFFVPFNTTIAPFAADSSSSSTTNSNSTQSFGVTDAQQGTAYTSWLNAGISAGVSGIMSYQWSQGNLTAQAGTEISPTDDTTGQSSSDNVTGQSPNDGYATQGVGEAAVQGAAQIVDNST
ncbi:hypothetical protein D9757_001897 [Collybiopsis confluens]|uniref:mannan endo-1,4-beta-mannosidase n=1 Tax=Collybiopsis confluens TaxID=2823264 RepID=A0A8H5HXV0_9AGAR|nr:hypothetical protein D9757_001897 [Collybiopsis confluens]